MDSGDHPEDEEPTKSAYLTKLAVFRDLSPEDIAGIAKVTQMIPTPKGRVFFLPDDTGKVPFFLAAGKLELYRLTPEGHKLVLDLLTPGTFFGGIAWVNPDLHDCYAETTEQALICVMSRADFERLMLEKPIVALRILEALGKRLVGVTTRLEETAFIGADERLAALLQRLAEPENGQLVVDGYTHEDLANMLGLYRETVTKAINRWKSRGMIQVRRKRLVLLEPDHSGKLA